MPFRGIIVSHGTQTRVTNTTVIIKSAISRQDIVEFYKQSVATGRQYFKEIYFKVSKAKRLHSLRSNYGGLFVCLFSVPLDNLSLIWRRYHLGTGDRRAANFAIFSF